MKKQSGFTLIELMVVMAIIAILATAGLSAYTSYIKGARDSSRLQIAKKIEAVVLANLSLTGEPPTPAALNAYLVSEGLAWKIEESTPLASVGNLLGNAIGIPVALAALKDPADGRPVCLDNDNLPTKVCQIVYYRFGDGTYAISYGVEKASNKVNFHHSDTTVPAAYGSFIGNNKDVMTLNGNEGTPLEGLIVSSVSSLRLTPTNYDNIAPETTVASSSSEWGTESSSSEWGTESSSSEWGTESSSSEAPTTIWGESTTIPVSST